MADPASGGVPSAGCIPGELRTERLRLVTLTPRLVRLALEDRKELGSELQARVPSSWPGADFARMLPRLADGPDDSSVAAPTRLIVHAADRAVIGEAGFHGPPDRTGTVEIGYSIVPERRGQGFASEATQALIEATFYIPGIRRIIAECLEDNGASLRVLEKLGMRRTRPAGGTVHFELRRP
ncbi:MAG TPA: GNAT family protein [Rubrobacter sp.]|nr:GNAT family protein [Rubrobacter sp.]